MGGKCSRRFRWICRLIACLDGMQARAFMSVFATTRLMIADVPSCVDAAALAPETATHTWNVKETIKPIQYSLHNNNG
jgi:hypothetical protein